MASRLCVVVLKSLRLLRLLLLLLLLLLAVVVDRRSLEP